MTRIVLCYDGDAVAMTDRKKPGDLTINELSRFEKRSGRVILEAYSHCEVPAGCGGVVLRYSDVFASVPMTLRMATGSVESATLWLDGEAHVGAWMDLSAGRHKLCVAVRAAEDVNFLQLALAYDPRTERRITGPSERLNHLALLSNSEGWRVTDQVPHPSWLQPGGDTQSAWRSPAVLDPATLVRRKAYGYYFDDLHKDGARAIGLLRHRGALWFEREFELNLTEERSLR